ncbi:acyltransferase [Enterococcus cecorum]|uniref:acyltransferase n=1 Tax=Enterococcus cecorum TaxID=44008 RepID=UPI002490AD10|nr:acyltransferase [Enterococcus cecorum]CAI3293272.1 acyltransferase [Enterococcus cecorum]
MNKYVRATCYIFFGFLKMTLLKVFHFGHFKGSIVCAISPLTEITLERDAFLEIGKKFRMKDGAKIRVRSGGECKIGRNTSLNTNNIVTCREKIIIGDDVQLAPNVQIYDHDHDYRAQGGVKAMKYVSTPIIIGNNVWIGANTIILRGTNIGDNVVVGAGSVVKGSIPSNTLFIQNKGKSVRNIQFIK